MDIQHKKKIQRNLVYIKDHIGDIENVVDHLIQKETISFDQRSKIIRENLTTREMCHKMIDHLFKAGPTAYDSFLAVLEETKNEHLVHRLNSTDVEDTKKTSETTDEEDYPQMASGNITDEEKRRSFELHKAMEESFQKLGENMDRELHKAMEKLGERMDRRSEENWQKLEDRIKEYTDKCEELYCTKLKLITLDGDYRTLQKAYSGLKEQLETGRKRLEGRNSDNIELKKRMDESAAKIDELQKKIEDVEEKKNETKDEVAILEETIFQLEREIERQKTELKEKKARIESLISEKHSTNKKNTALKDQAQKDMKTIEDLLCEIKKLKTIKNKTVVTYVPPFCSAASDTASKNVNYKK